MNCRSDPFPFFAVPLQSLLVKMNIEDQSIANAERDADPVRWANYGPSNPLESTRHETLHSGQTAHQAEEEHTEAREDLTEEVERESSVSSSGSSIRDESQIRRHAPSTVSRSSTRMEYDLMEYLDRHPTAMKRMQERELSHTCAKLWQS